MPNRRSLQKRSLDTLLLPVVWVFRNSGAIKLKRQGSPGIA
jgi:hypothetical protein